MAKSANKKRPRVTIALTSDEKYPKAAQEAANLVQLLAQSPYWTISTDETTEADVLITHFAFGQPVSRSTVKIIRVLDPEALSPIERDALAERAQDSYFACTSEETREALLATSRVSRHRSYVVPSSVLSDDATTATITSANALAHWQQLIRTLTRRRDIPAAEPVRITALRPREMISPLSLSVVISSEGMDKRLIACLNIISPQVEAMDAEFLVGLKKEPGTETLQWPAVRFFYEPGGNVLSLRAKGISMATGEIVAIMEDHGLPGKDWCQRVVEAHKAHPAVPIIYGPVIHGGPFGITSWANFLVNYGLFMQPLEFSPRRRVPPIVGATIKRGYLPEGEIAEGWFEFTDMPKFHDLELCRADESLLVRHIQHHGFIGTYQAHYHNARVTTGIRKLIKGTPAWKDQLKNSFRVPRQLIGIDWMEIWSLKVRRGILLKTLPCYVGIVFAHMIGEIVGLYYGPGRSAEYID